SELPSASVREGCVIAQDPPAGTPVPTGTVVSLSLSSGAPVQWVAVPGLAGLDLGRAEHALRRAGFTVGDVVQAPSATVRANLVISQDPPAGTSAAAGTPVNLVVSSGAPTQLVRVPSVATLPLPAAEVLLRKAGLSVGTISKVAAPTVPLHCVVSQDPAAGTTVPAGSAVNLALSAIPAKRFVLVPQLIGATRNEAERRLSRAGLALGEIGQAPSDTVAAGQVMAQSPDAGLQVEEGSPVSFVISTGTALLSVPQVVGMPLDAARAALHAAGFRAGRVAERETPGIPGRVIDQNPNGGANAARGSLVDLVVSAPPRGNPIPAVVGLDLTQATAQLTASGFAVGQVTRQDPGRHGIANNTVLDQSPEAESIAAPGTRVNLVVAWRERQSVRVPSLRGRNYNEAIQELSSLGLTVGRVENRPVAPGQVGKVIDQDPGPNSRVFEGTAVNLVVGVQESEPMVLVPACLMLSENKAVNAIQAAGLDAKVKHVIGIPRGRVIFQFPPPGTPVKKGAEVVIHVNK
ncbi:MAG: PASTA domain-containing protein, partial [Planctomycetes bacterium]|nr:PASTA domain-containing protein [Planctomycetota bacterium]